MVKNNKRTSTKKNREKSTYKNKVQQYDILIVHKTTGTSRKIATLQSTVKTPTLPQTITATEMIAEDLKSILKGTLH